MNYPRLFTPLEIKPGFTLKNRIVMPAMHHLYTDGGRCTPRFCQYYWRRAEGGLAMAIVGSCRFDDYGAKDNSMSLRTDDVVDGWREFTDGMHQRGTKVAVQLYHAGRYVPERDVPCGRPALAPSAVYSTYTHETAPAMSREQINEVIVNWAAGAVRARKAGFDAVEILGSAGYLISQFLSPVTNLREDEYGGSWENRCRFPLEVIRAVRAAVGPEYPIIFRLGAKDFIPGSNGLEEAKRFAVLAQGAGVDLFNVTGGWHETKVPQLPGDVPPGALTYLSRSIREVVSVPVMMCNRINTPALAEEVLALGRADLIGMGRPMLADPDFANKARDGRSGEIRPCVACNQGCLANTFFDKPVRCTVNGLCGLGYRLKPRLAAEPQKFLVVGGGPAGCECAIRLAQRGHCVTLWEQSGSLGGQLRLASKIPSRYEFTSLIRYYETVLRTVGVTVKLNRTATPLTVQQGSFDQVIVATGGQPNRTELPPAPPSMTVCTTTEVLTGQVIPGKQVVLIGGSFVGCDTARYIARQSSLTPDQLYYLLAWQAEPPAAALAELNRCDREITLVEQGPKIGFGYEPGTSWPTLAELDRLGVKRWKNTRVTAIGADSVTVERQEKDGTLSAERIPCDTVVVASGVHPDSSLYTALRARGIPAELIGNARKLGRAIDAISEAAQRGSIL